MVPYFRTSLVTVAGVVVALAGCSSPSPPTSCARRPVPAFRLEVTSSDGDVPAGTRLEVMYGGRQSGSYVLGGTASTNEDVCCRPSAHAPFPLPHVSCGVDAGQATTRAGAILCELWTDGVAEVRVHATGYPVLDRMLSAKITDPICGVDTVDVRITLSHADGGS